MFHETTRLTWSALVLPPGCNRWTLICFWHRGKSQRQVSFPKVWQLRGRVWNASSPGSEAASGVWLCPCTAMALAQPWASFALTCWQTWGLSVGSEDAARGKGVGGDDIWAVEGEMGHCCGGGSVESGVMGLWSNEEYKCTRNWVSLVLLVLDVISHNVEVLFYEETSLHCLLNLILHLRCPCTIWKIIHD